MRRCRWSAGCSKIFHPCRSGWCSPGPPRYPNAKVHGMEEMMKVAAHEILVISDSDVRVERDYLRSVVAPLADPKVGLVTCLSRVVPGDSFWSLLESLSMNTQFAGGVLSAWLLEGMKFALGPTMVVRKQQVQEIGGLRALGDYHADDFRLGELIAEAGYCVVLSERHSRSPVLRRGDGGFLAAPAALGTKLAVLAAAGGYIGQIFTHSIPLALLALGIHAGGNRFYALVPGSLPCGSGAAGMGGRMAAAGRRHPSASIGGCCRLRIW